MKRRWPSGEPPTRVVIPRLRSSAPRTHLLRGRGEQLKSLHPTPVPTHSRPVGAGQVRLVRVRHPAPAQPAQVEGARRSTPRLTRPAPKQRRSRRHAPKRKEAMFPRVPLLSCVLQNRPRSLLSGSNLAPLKKISAHSIRDLLLTRSQRPDRRRQHIRHIRHRAVSPRRLPLREQSPHSHNLQPWLIPHVAGERRMTSARSASRVIPISPDQGSDRRAPILAPSNTQPLSLHAGQFLRNRLNQVPAEYPIPLIQPDRHGSTRLQYPRSSRSRSLSLRQWPLWPRPCSTHASASLRAGTP